VPFHGSIYDNQTDILNWIKSRGGRVDYGQDHRSLKLDRHKRKSCETKVRFTSEPPPMVGMVSYKCNFCRGWHKATR
jgi:hypothetical protein